MIEYNYEHHNIIVPRLGFSMVKEIFDCNSCKDGCSRIFMKFWNFSLSILMWRVQDILWSKLKSRDFEEV